MLTSKMLWAIKWKGNIKCYCVFTTEAIVVKEYVLKFSTCSKRSFPKNMLWNSLPVSGPWSCEVPSHSYQNPSVSLQTCLWLYSSHLTFVLCLTWVLISSVLPHEKPWLVCRIKETRHFGFLFMVLCCSCWTLLHSGFPLLVASWSVWAFMFLQS